MKRRLELSSGIEVELRPVPPYVLMKAAQKLPLPDVPTKTVSTPAGEQEVTVGVDTPEYKAFAEEMEEIQNERFEQHLEMTLNYGVKRWRLKPQNILHRAFALLGLGYQWEDEPPGGWEMPEAFRDAVESTGDRRLDYILLMILADTEDFSKVMSQLQDTSQDLTTEEVETAEGSFRGGVEGDGTSRGARNEHQEPDDVHRDAGSEGVGD